MLQKLILMSMDAGVCVLLVLLVRMWVVRKSSVCAYRLWMIVAFRLLTPGISWIYPFSEKNTNAAAMQPVYLLSSGFSLRPALSHIVSHEKALTVIWLTGVLSLFGILLLRLHFLKTALKDAVCIFPNVYECKTIDTAFVFGLFSPRIYLPAHMDVQARGYVIAHEQCHIRRRDHLVKLFAAMLLCVYWFHPLLWIAWHFVCLDMEAGCDEKTVFSYSIQQKKEYCRTLVNCATGKGVMFVTNITGSQKGIQKRIHMILSRKPLKKGAKMGIAAFTALLFFALASKNCLSAADIATQNTAVSIEWVKQNGYPVNESGETYGPTFPGYEAELIACEIQDGGLGYLRREDFYGNSHIIPVYSEDGKTVIGSFTMTSDHTIVISAGFDEHDVLQITINGNKLTVPDEILNKYYKDPTDIRAVIREMGKAGYIDFLPEYSDYLWEWEDEDE
ncbi:MAG: M56 family metallopeptidase [Muribaculaceae bacterium]|nr:M56 family metallopeptidase [Roseburia sp.]MCM1430698.1 M56 family metallopeptidase [Muribaculaceae bacterium]MCM1491965.1 M56 family metallopeptidase [Muribaculaceae bacterium]